MGKRQTCQICLSVDWSAHLSLVLFSLASAFAPVPFSACLSLHRKVQVVEWWCALSSSPACPVQLCVHHEGVLSPKQHQTHAKSCIDTAGHAESPLAVKYTGTCPLVHPRRSKPVQEEARSSESPCLHSYNPGLQCCHVHHGLQRAKNWCLLQEIPIAPLPPMMTKPLLWDWRQ